MKKEIERLDFNLDRSMRYHARRQAFLESWHRLIMFSVLLLGSAAFADVIGSPKWLALASAILAALDLVIGFSIKAREHALLQRRFIDLAVAVRRAKEPTADDLAQWQVARLEIEKDEPPTYRGLNLACFNEAIVARGLSRDDMVSINWFVRLFMNVYRFPNYDPKSPRDIRNNKLSATTL